MEKPFWSALKIPLHHYYCYYVHYMWFLVWYKENKFECHAALRSLFILILRPLTLVLEKKSFYNFPLSSLRHSVSKEKTKCHFSTTFTTADILIATTSTMLWLWQKSIYFHFSTTAFATLWWKKFTFPLLLIATIPLHRDYVKKIFFL